MADAAPTQPPETPDWALSSWELRERKRRRLAEAQADPNRDPLIGRTLADLPEAEREAAAQRVLDAMDASRRVDAASSSKRAA